LQSVSSLEAERRGLAVYGEKRIPKRVVESLFHCEPSRLRNRLPPHLKAPIPIASDQTAGQLDDLQNRGSIVYVDRFFDAKGDQIQDTQVARDPLPSTVLMVNAMNTSLELSALIKSSRNVCPSKICLKFTRNRLYLPLRLKNDRALTLT
jgi:hypothetical protein